MTVRNGMTIDIKRFMAARLTIALVLVSAAVAAAQDPGNDQTRSVSLTVPAGVATSILSDQANFETIACTGFMAILGGDFTPLHVAQIEFTSLLPASGPPIDGARQGSSIRQECRARCQLQPASADREVIQAP